MQNLENLIFSLFKFDLTKTNKGFFNNNLKKTKKF